jgi:hypothetical protein
MNSDRNGENPDVSIVVVNFNKSELTRGVSLSYLVMYSRPLDRTQSGRWNAAQIALQVRCHMIAIMVQSILR